VEGIRKRREKEKSVDWKERREKLKRK